MKKFLITGVQMKNKGAQALLFSTINGLRARYPDCEVVCMGLRQSDLSTERFQYTFPIALWDQDVQFLLATGLDRFAPVRNSKRFARVLPLLADARAAWAGADGVFDASGYVLGSGWNVSVALSLLFTIRTALRFSVPAYVLPQSFGPFAWKRFCGPMIHQSRRMLNKAACVYAREHAGLDALREIGVKNAQFAPDLVLLDRDFDAAGRYIKDLPARDFSMYRGHVGVILNENLFRTGRDPENVLALYQAIVDALLEKKVPFLILRSSDADKPYIERLLARYPEGALPVLSDELASPEIALLMRELRFVVASRFHSLVFALRAGVPVVALGWAEKYRELMRMFALERYCFDFHTCSGEDLASAIDGLLENEGALRALVSDRLAEIQQRDVFSEIEF